MYNQKPLLGTLPNYAHPLIPNVGAWIMNEGSGNKIYDIIGSNHGTFGVGAAAPTWVPGRAGPALDFDGDDYINCGSDNSLNIIGDHSIIAWINTADITARQGIYDRYHDMKGISFMHKGFLGSNGELSYYNIGCGWESSTGVITANTWYQVAVVVDVDVGGNFYINGQDAGSWSDITSAPTSVSHDAEIGRDYNLNYFNGEIDEVEIYNRTLSANEVWQLYVNPYCWLTQPMEAELMYAAPPVGAILNQFQKTNLGADLYDGVLIT